MPMMLIGSPLYDMAKLQKSVRINLDTAAAFYNRMLAVTAVHTIQGNQAVQFKLLKDDQKATKSKTNMRKSSWNPRDEISTELTDLDVLTRAEII